MSATDTGRGSALVTALRGGAVGGFLYGGLLYGAPLACLHLIYNATPSPWDGAVTLLYFFALYGGWAAVFFLLTTALCWLAARLLTPVLNPKLLLARGVSLGIFLFNLTFWLLYFLYGLTYDQLPPFLREWQGVTPMVLYLVLLGIVVTAVVGAISWLLGRLLMSLAESRRFRIWMWGAVATALLLGILIPLAFLPVNFPHTAVSPPPMPEVEERSFPVFFLGLDGADWQVMTPMLEQGELPHFQQLIEDGVAAPLATLRDSNSAVIWASAYTGLPPQRHGVHDFYRIELLGMGGRGLFPVHRTYFKELAGYLERFGLARRTMVSRFDLAGEPIWEVAHHLGQSIGVVDGYFYSFPIYPDLPSESFFLAYGLDGFERRLRQGGGRPGDLPLFLHPPEIFREVRPFLEKGDFHWQADSLLHLLESGRPQPRLLSFYTHEPDTAQHHYWKWYQPERFLGATEAEIAEKGEYIPDLYRAFDRFLGELLPRLDPETAILIASDHGHAATILHQRFFTQHRHGPPGIVIASGGAFRKTAPELEEPHIYDLFPTLLYLLGSPVPEDIPGRVWTEGIDPAFLDRYPVRTQRTFRGLFESPWQGALGEDQERNQQEIDKLKSLGYL